MNGTKDAVVLLGVPAAPATVGETAKSMAKSMRGQIKNFRVQVHNNSVVRVTLPKPVVRGLEALASSRGVTVDKIVEDESRRVVRRSRSVPKSIRRRLARGPEE